MGQDRQGCNQEVACGWQEGIQEHQRLDRGCPEGQEGARCERLRRGQEGLRTLQEGQGVLQLSASSMPVAATVGSALVSVRGMFVVIHGMSTCWSGHCTPGGVYV